LLAQAGALIPGVMLERMTTNTFVPGLNRPATVLPPRSRSTMTALIFPDWFSAKWRSARHRPLLAGFGVTPEIAEIDFNHLIAAIEDAAASSLRPSRHLNFCRNTTRN